MPASSTASGMASYAGFLAASARWAGGVSQGGAWWLALLLAGSRVLQTIALFLPIKLLILFTADGPPSYMALLPAFVTIEALTAALVAAVPVLYGGYVVSNIVFQRLLDVGRKRVAAAPPRALPGGAGVEAKSAPHLLDTTVRGAADWITVAGTLVVTAVLSPAFGLVAALMMVGFIALAEWVVFSPAAAERVTRARITKRQFIEFCGAGAYVAAFAGLAALALVGDLDIYAAILALLLVRLMVQALQRFATASITTRKDFARLIAARADGAAVADAGR